MSTKIIDYTLNSLNVANPDTTNPAVVNSCKVIGGPGNTYLGNYANALDFNPNGSIQVVLPVAQLNFSKFCVRVLFMVPASVTARQTLMESDCLPFSIYVDKCTGSSELQIVTAVSAGTSGWAQSSTQNFIDLHLNTWYCADLVYDTDTLSVFIDGVIYSVHAFPAGEIVQAAGNKLYIGTTASGTANQFLGSMAAVQLHNDIPIELEAQLDERRSHPEWYITYKYEALKPAFNLGNPVGIYALASESVSYVQNYDAGLIMYNESNGIAFEMNGAIWQRYISLSAADKQQLGYLVTDEINGAKKGSRKNLFSSGGIYWSPNTGAIQVTGQVYVDFEGMGEANAIGLPVSAATSIPQGVEQIFESARMYYKDGAPKANEVHGAILGKFLDTGGVGTWGFPITNEVDVMSGGVSIGRMSDFEKCTIYWTSATGSHEVNGDIRSKYKNQNGPLSPLGFPISDEGDVPGAAGSARYSAFQNGSIVWFGNYAQTFVCYPFDFYIGRIDTIESEGFLMGQNDVYANLTIIQNGQVAHTERLPESGDTDGNNIFDVNRKFVMGNSGIVPNDPNLTIKFCIDIWDSDPIDDDDHLGYYEKVLNISNAWGLRDNAMGVFNSGQFSNINSITWSIQPRINEADLPSKSKWWGVRNLGTDEITYHQYASAFYDVDSDTEWWNPEDWLQDLFYELAIKDLAKDGNCFGMSLEAIYAKKHRSVLSLPIDRFTDWNTVVNEFNIKHQYQAGAAAIWWFVGQFLSGETHDPVSIFTNTRDEFLRGNDPVICISQNYDFSGAPHCILPVEWDASSKPWKLKIYDPNFRSFPDSPSDPIRTIIVDPDSNTFTYDGGRSKYNGGEWDGGRFHYMPYCVLNERPRTPIFEALMLLMSGTILFLGSDAQTSSLTDENGVDLDAFGTDSVDRLKAGRPMQNKFVSVKGFDQTPILKSNIAATMATSLVPDFASLFGQMSHELYMRSLKPMHLSIPPVTIRPNLSAATITLGDFFAHAVKPSTVAGKLPAPQLLVANKARLMMNLNADDKFHKIISRDLSEVLKTSPSFTDIGKDYTHKFKGVRNGKMQYVVKHKLNQFKIEGDISAGEDTVIKVKDLGSHSSEVSISASRTKNFNLVMHNKLGVGNDYIKITIPNVPIQAGTDISLNLKPGLSGIDMVAPGLQIKTTMECEAGINGQIMKGSFDLDEIGGLRILPSTMITRKELKVSKISSIFGPTLASKIITMNA